MRANLPANEVARLEALRRYEILDTFPEQSYNDFTALAAYICQTPIALISLIDEHRQWFKAKLGLGVNETHRDSAFCAHAILQTDVLLVPDAAADQRFSDNDLVTGEPHIRFYAGAPLLTPDGFELGTLCVIDRVPRTINEAQTKGLKALSRQIIIQMEYEFALKSINTLRGLLPICSYCKKIRDDQDYWHELETYVRQNTAAEFSHGICPPCYQDVVKPMLEKAARAKVED